MKSVKAIRVIKAYANMPRCVVNNCPYCGQRVHLDIEEGNTKGWDRCWNCQKKFYWRIEVFK